jgi:tryptophan synthase alpha chain
VKDKIFEKFSSLKKKGEMALITYLTFNFPDPEKFKNFLHAIIEGGSDIIEIGVPFSDPIADGKVIQSASEIALSFGTSLEEILEFLERERKNIPVPLILMGYMNPFLQFGIENLSKIEFVDGFIIPDLSYEETIRLKIHKKIPLIQLIAPTTSIERAKKIAEISHGFVYYVSITGTTGSRIKDINGIRKFVGEFKKVEEIPIVIGFGIRSSEDIKKLSFADGVVIGSALLRKISEKGMDFKKAREFVKSLKRATINKI